MKDGSGHNPFEDTEVEDESPQSDADVTPETELDTSQDSKSTDAGQTFATKADLPYVLRRDRVQDGRDAIPLYVRPDTKDREVELRTAVAKLLDKSPDDVSKLDLREAALRAASPEDVAQSLRDDGYDLL